MSLQVKRTHNSWSDNRTNRMQVETLIQRQLRKKSKRKRSKKSKSQTRIYQSGLYSCSCLGGYCPHQQTYLEGLGTYSLQSFRGRNDMSFKLGKRSIEKLEGVDPTLVKIVEKAIQVSEQDFSVICGLRTKAEQEALVAKGASQTMKSKHLEGKAVDLMAYVAGSGGRWELNLYDEIADAMAQAASLLRITNLRWGAAWHINDIGSWWENGKPMEEAMNDYVDLRRSQGRRPFIDAPHFELV